MAASNHEDLAMDPLVKIREPAVEDLRFGSVSGRWVASPVPPGSEPIARPEVADRLGGLLGVGGGI
ncbi:MAG: hypothetical protein WA709_27200 [Stellaceae bacterium]